MCVILILCNASVLGAPLENANDKEIQVEGKDVYSVCLAQSMAEVKAT